jgi:hypothetical protein
MLLVDVELGRMMDYRQITPHLTAPPQGFDSCHGTAPPPLCLTVIIRCPLDAALTCSVVGL